MFQIFPLLAISLVAYVILTLLLGPEWGAQILLEVNMVSDDVWKVSYGDAFIIISMALLFVEILRATQTGTDSILNHVFSFIVFVIALLVFLFMEGCGNSVFFIYLTMTLLDFMAGFIVTTMAARRDFGVAGGALGG